MRIRNLLVIANAIGVLTVALVLAAQSPEAFYGMWKVDVAKSKYSPGPAPKTNMKKFEPWQDGFKATQDMVTAKGDKVHLEVAAKLDGKDYPATGSADADTFAFKKLSARTYEVVQKKDGKVTVTSNMVIAPDGKSRVITQTGKNVKGQPVNNQIYWDKQ